MFPTGVHHVAIQVRELEAMTHFYGNVLGLPLVRRWPRVDGGGDRSVWLALGVGAFLALEQCAGELRPVAFHDAAPGLHLVALAIAPFEREPWRERLRRAGVAVVHETAYTLYFHDPEGNRVALSHYPDEAPGA